jgi:hypothetical protein
MTGSAASYRIFTACSSDYHSDLWLRQEAERHQEVLPFFLDSDQVAALEPDIDWTRRVSARIEHFRKWAATA